MGRREAKKQLKREGMLREGLRLFLDQGYERASVEQIAQAVEQPVGSAYRLAVEDRPAHAGGHVHEAPVQPALDAAGISIPFPQQDVHLFVEKKERAVQAGRSG